MIKIYEPDIEQYKLSALDAINSGWISNHGIYIQKATNKMMEILDIPYLVLMSNGTCATHCLFIALKFAYPNIQKIYVPGNCYVAAWNTLLMEYSLKHISVLPMSLETWNMDIYTNIYSLDKNSAVLVVHNLGNIINVPELKKLRPDLIFVEDNCEGIFGKYNHVYSGCSSDSLCSSLSFYGNKTITTGEGGAFLTTNKDVYEYIKLVYSQGMSETRYLHTLHAFNYRMTNIQAAFLYDQLLDLETILSKKRNIFLEYEQLLEPLLKSKRVVLMKKEDYTTNACWIFGVRIVNNPFSINETNDFFKSENVEIRPFFYPINEHQHLSDIQYDDPNSKKLNKEIIMIPSSPNISILEQQKVVAAISKFVSQIKFNF
jgi:perosamine synthetase